MCAVMTTCQEVTPACEAMFLLELEATRLSCHRFRANEVGLQLSVFAYNLGNLWRRLRRDSLRLSVRSREAGRDREAV